MSSARIIGCRIVGLKLDRPAEIGNRHREIALVLVNIAPADIGGGVVGLDRDGLIIIVHRGLQVPSAQIDKRPVVVSLVELRVDLYRGGEIHNRLLVISRLAIGRSPEIKGVRVARVLRDHRGYGGDVVLLVRR